VRNRVGDVRHAQAAIGFRALVGLEQGIRHLSDWRGAQAASAGAAP
jgi:nucleoside-diphosphate-sugar epimerase